MAILRFSHAEFRAMDWDEVLLWWHEADAVHGETYGLGSRTQGETR
ncbi:conserved hypothetical protein [Roseibium sp. TrichSKD4]|nr:hypothetical protein [Roseibium sp. TrichSKD4]EFO31689.1 conserved hypothetical protein [Roseibium sp. TrichSKD4]